MIKFIIFIFILILVWLAFMHDKDQGFMPTFGDSQPAAVVPNFNCMGKRNCSEMTSCEEAKFYLRNCPDTGQLDPDRDGVPCEDLCANQ